MKSGDDPEHQRALRYIARPELARARMAPPFSVTTLDGKQISMDDLQGKVVLLDFLGHLVRPLPRSPASHARYREKIPGPAPGYSQRQPRQR